MIIIDFSQILFANVYADDSVASCAKNPSEMSKNMLMHFGFNSLRSHFVTFRQRYGDEFIIACDSRSWRYDVFPQYKWARKQNRENDTSGIDWKFVAEVNDEIYAALDAYFPFITLKVKGAEADDINGIMVNMVANRTSEDTDIFGDSDPEKIILLSTDKDNYQLHKHKNFKQWSQREKKLVGPATTPQKALLEKIVKGDSGDGIPNIKSPDNTFVDKIRQKPISSKYLEKFYASKNPIEVCETEQEKINFRRNEMLVSYDKTPIEIRDAVISQYNEKKLRKVSKSNLMNYFISKQMNILMSNIQDFF